MCVTVVNPIKNHHLEKKVKLKKFTLIDLSTKYTYSKNIAINQHNMLQNKSRFWIFLATQVKNRLLKIAFTVTKYNILLNLRPNIFTILVSSSKCVKYSIENLNQWPEQVCYSQNDSINTHDNWLLTLILVEIGWKILQYLVDTNMTKVSK